MLDDPNALALLGGLSDATLPHSATIEARTVTRGDGGSHTSSWAAVGAAVGCRLTPASASDQQVAAVRRIVAALVRVGRGSAQRADVAQALAGRRPAFNGDTAPAHGLILWRVPMGPAR